MHRLEMMCWNPCLLIPPSIFVLENPKNNIEEAVLIKTSGQNAVPVIFGAKIGHPKWRLVHNDAPCTRTRKPGQMIHLSNFPTANPIQPNQPLQPTWPRANGAGCWVCTHNLSSTSSSASELVIGFLVEADRSGVRHSGKPGTVPVTDSWPQRAA